MIGVRGIRIGTLYALLKSRMTFQQKDPVKVLRRQRGKFLKRVLVQMPHWLWPTLSCDKKNQIFSYHTCPGPWSRLKKCIRPKVMSNWPTHHTGTGKGCQNLKDWWVSHYDINFWSDTFFITWSWLRAGMLCHAYAPLTFLELWGLKKNNLCHLENLPNTKVIMIVRNPIGIKQIFMIMIYHM